MFVAGNAESPSDAGTRKGRRLAQAGLDRPGAFCFPGGGQGEMVARKSTVKGCILTEEQTEDIRNAYLAAALDREWLEETVCTLTLAIEVMGDLYATPVDRMEANKALWDITRALAHLPKPAECLRYAVEPVLQAAG